MIAIGCATNDELAFRARAAIAIETLDRGDSLLLRRHHCDSFDVPYNEMLAAAGAREDLEAIVLLHQDAVVEADGRRILARIRGLLAAGPDVAVVGTVDGGRPREVAAAGGTLLALSAWAARNLRFEPALGASVDASAHDISLQAQAAGRRVVAARLGVARAWAPEGPAERRRLLRAGVELRRRWEVQEIALDRLGT